MELIRTLLSRCTALFHTHKLDAELDEELRAHIDLAIEENINRGMSPEQARTTALRDFGGVTQVTESYRTQRGLPFLEVLAQDIRYALRQLRNSPGFASHRDPDRGSWGRRQYCHLQRGAGRGPGAVALSSVRSTGVGV